MIVRKSGRKILIRDLMRLDAIPLFHACQKEDIVSCYLETGDIEVNRERIRVVQDRIHYKCLKMSGNVFFVNSLSFAVMPCNL
jgi:hypothetical protein